MRVLVTGGSGQLAQSLRKVQPQGIVAFYPGKQELNLEQRADLQAFLAKNPVEYIINCAAYTKVDMAQKEREAAFAANEKAVGNLAETCAERKVYPIHISTDFLFHGSFNRPIDESQKINPVGVYAESKAAGENILQQARIPSAIVRTSWLYSEYGNNFMKTMLRLGREKPEVRVVADQHGSPTYATDLARGLWHMITQLRSKPARSAVTDIYHFSNYGVITWYDFAAAILGIAGLRVPVEPILTEEYPLPTPRPAYSAFWPRKFSKDFRFPIRHWRTALVDAVTALKVSEGAL
jgi:dTDP-4-dehydrorhamnose reductase